MPREAETKGIPPAQTGALAVLQFTPNYGVHQEGIEGDIEGKVLEAAIEINKYHDAPEAQPRFDDIREHCVGLMVALVRNCPPGPYRSTAISRLQEVRMWANGAIALEGV